MKTWRLWAHPALEESIESLNPATGDMIRNKVLWAQVQLACRGETTIIKGVRSHDVGWRRTPVKGNEYYLWWIKAGTKGTESLSPGADNRDIFLRIVRQHDLTKDALDPGTREDYAEVDVAVLDPRFQEQRDVVPPAYSLMCVRTVTGYPGSGKTIALLYAARELVAQGHILYVTYTDTLAKEAREFFQATGLADNVSVRTLAELESDLLAESLGPDLLLSPTELYQGFVALVNQSFGRNYPWLRGVELALWEQVRAYLLGMALPFTWRRGEVQIPECDLLTRNTFTEVFEGWGSGHLDLLYRLADQAIQRGLCIEQKRARQALDLLVGGKLLAKPRWMDNLRGLVVDEIQDLTPVQIALLAEVAGWAYARIPDRSRRCFALVAAGDESQIVQPSGFEWAIAKDLLHERLGVIPEPIGLSHQRRSPRRLAQLLNNTWPLYMSTRRRSEEMPTLPDDAEEGKLLCCQLGASCDWVTLLRTMANAPGRAFVDLDGTLRDRLAQVDAVGEFMPLIHTPQAIKGLDRRTVLVWHLGATITQHQQLTGAGGFVGLQARHAIGSIRVALSRSTETLVILRDNGTEGLSPLKLEEIDGVQEVDLEGLLYHLDQEEFSDEERVEGFLLEANEALEHDNLDLATERNKRAQELLHLVEDPDLRAQTSGQYHRIRRRRVEPILDEAGDYLRQGMAAAALQANQRAERALEATDEQALRDSIVEQRKKIERYPVEMLMQEAEKHYQHHEFERAIAANARAADLAAKLIDPYLRTEVSDQDRAIHKDYVESLLTEADLKLEKGDTQSALVANRRAGQLLEPAGDSSLKEQIRAQHEKIQRTRVQQLLQEAQDYAKRRGYEKALTTISEAGNLATELADADLVHVVEEERLAMLRRHLGNLLQQAEKQLEQGDLAEATAINVQAGALVDEVGDSKLTVSFSGQQIRIELTQLLREAEGYRAKKEPLAAYRACRSFDSLASAQGLSLQGIPALGSGIRSVRKWLQPQFDQLTDNCYREGRAATERGDWAAAATAFRDAASIRADQNNPKSAEAWQSLADRYGKLPPPLDSTDPRVKDLLTVTGRYMSVMASTGKGKHRVARGFAQEWLRECLPATAQQPQLLPIWLSHASRIADWSECDIATLYPDLAFYAKLAIAGLGETGQDPRISAKSLQAAGQEVPPDLQELCELMNYAENLPPSGPPCPF